MVVRKIMLVMIRRYYTIHINYYTAAEMVNMTYFEKNIAQSEEFLLLNVLTRHSEAACLHVLCV